MAFKPKSIDTFEQDLTSFKPNEKRHVQQPFIKELKRLNIPYVTPQPGPGFVAGTPDVIMCLRGKFIGVEFKIDINGKHKQTIQQKKWHVHINQNKGEYWLVDMNNLKYYKEKLCKEI